MDHFLRSSSLSWSAVVMIGFWTAFPFEVPMILRTLAAIFSFEVRRRSCDFFVDLVRKSIVIETVMQREI